MYAFIAGSVSWIEDDAVVVQNSGLGLHSGRGHGIRLLGRTHQTI